MLVASVQQNTATGAAFSVAVHPDRAYVVVAPAGELDMATVGPLERELAEMRDAGFAEIVLDLRGLAFIDSSGLNFLLREHSAAQASGLSFRLIEGSEATRRLFDLTGTADEFDFVTAS